MVVHLLHHKRWIIFLIKLKLVWAQSKKFYIIMSDIVEILACHFPKSNELFRLRKNYKKLALTAYSENLKIYLSKLQCSAEVTWEDFDAAVSSLKTIV